MQETNSLLPESDVAAPSTEQWHVWRAAIKKRVMSMDPVAILTDGEAFTDNPFTAVSKEMLADEMEDWSVSAKSGDYSDVCIRQAVRLAYQSSALLDLVSRERWISFVDSLLVYCQQIDDCSVWGRTVLGVEIPAVLVLQYEKWNTIDRLIPGIQKTLKHESQRVFDGQGLIHARNWQQYAPLLASWARASRVVGKCSLKIKFPKSFLIQLQWSVRQLLLLTNSQGELFFSGGRALSKGIVDLLLEIAGNLSDRRLAAEVKLAAKPDVKGMARVKRPPATLHSEWAQMSVLRSGWSRKRRELGVRFEGSELELEMSSCGQPLLRGLVQTNISIDGDELVPKGSWTEICWQNDTDADYLELEMQFTKGWCLQRQMCVSKRTPVVLVADALMSNKAGDIKYNIQLPLADPFSMVRSEKNHPELKIKVPGMDGLVMPLGIPEWNMQQHASFSGSLEVNQRLSHSIRARCSRGLYAPLLFALGPKSAGKQYTWRRLTVAQNLKIEMDENAVAFRVQLGGRQWLLYRSMTDSGNRTFLGQNYSTEFVFGEFRLDGRMHKYVEIS